ncbi:MAG: TIGR04255 family protein [Candidatus Melainabacteria bacterium]|nr:TIGR04255 family protein [Cyanobacteria bacterium REEB446]MEB3315703.1 TIGR04255 family protein [Candidatus Melainabacteria bacterium]
MVEFNFSKEYERLEFTQNPLVDVILRIDFAPILDVDTKEVLARYQREIKQWFPHYEKNIEYVHRIDSLVFGNKQAEESLVHNFISKDKSQTISVSQKVFVLNFKRYKSFKQFEDVFKNNWKNFKNTFSTPSLITRLGLRYVNLIEKEKFMTKEESWIDLIDSDLVPELKNYMQVNDQCYIKSLNKDLDLSLQGDNVHLKLAILKAIETNEDAFLIDIDSFRENKDGIDEEEINECIKCFNKRTRNIFRPFITDNLLQKLS